MHNRESLVLPSEREAEAAIAGIRRGRQLENEKYFIKNQNAG